MLRIFGRNLPLRLQQQSWLEPAQSLSVAARGYAKQMPPRKKIEESDIEESFLKGSGPGGQKINKTNSAVQLKHLPTGVVVKCQETRSRTQNRKTARKWLEEKLDTLENGDSSRVAVKAAAKSKKKASADKKKRRKYKKLAEGQAADTDSREPFENDEMGQHTDVDSVAESKQ